MNCYKLQAPSRWCALIGLQLCFAASLLAFDPVRFPGPYCAARQSDQQCCPGRDDQCTVPIHDTLCYCDEFCYQHSIEDCCPDFKPACDNVDNVISDCKRNEIEFKPGDSYMDDCNQCTCMREKTSSGSRDVWRCTQDACINDQTMISRINSRSLRWQAAAYRKFDGLKLKEGIRYFLGTQEPSKDVVKLHPISSQPGRELPVVFDSREKWPGLIHPPMDQGQCGSSWAFSTTGVASDRWAIQSNGLFNSHLSPQQLLDCNKIAETCQPSRVEHAWWILQRQGLVQQTCYPYTGAHQPCRTESEVVCPAGKVPHTLKMTPPYRIAKDERDIMHEIITNGPVQAIMRVRADFFIYKNGVYSYSREPEYDQSGRNYTLVGTHSVKIIGWGVEGGNNKYWLAMNSWGRRWGENGLFRIRRGENESGIEGFVIGVWPRTEKHVLKEKEQHRHSHKHRV